MVRTRAQPYRAEYLIAALVLLLLLAGAAAVLLPFASALAWALVMAYALWPVQHWLSARLTHATGPSRPRAPRRTLVALIMTGGIALVLIVPTAAVVARLADDAAAVRAAGERWMADGPPPAPQWLRRVPAVGPRLAQSWETFTGETHRVLKRVRDAAREDAQTGESRSSAARDGSVAATGPETELVAPPPVVQPSAPAATAPADLGTRGGATTRRAVGADTAASVLVAIARWLGHWLPVAGLVVVHGLTQVLLSVFLTFFIFKDGAALAQRLTVATHRLGGEPATQLLAVAGGTVRGVVYGILGTALAQGALMAAGLWLAGVPGAALLGLVTFFLSPLPVGPPLVWIPAALWLYHQGSPGWAAFMIVWGLLVSSIDNVIKPLIISRGSATPFILVLMGVIGGALAFGLLGVFLGPTLLAVAYRLIEQWSRQPLLAADSPATANTATRAAAPAEVRATLEPVR